MTTEPEYVTDPEIVPTEPAAPPAVVDDTRAVIDRAAQHALDNPGVAGRDEFLALAAQARILSMSGAAPDAVRDDPYVAFHLALVGRDFGISPTAAMTLIDILERKRGGKIEGYQFALSPQLMNAQIRRLGLGSIVPAVRQADRCVAVVLEPGGRLDHRCTGDRWPNHVDGCSCHGIIGESEFTWDDARIAGLVGGDCRPGEHVEKTQTRGERSWKACGCNQGYKTYPKRMMWWRAAGFAADDWLPEAGLGMYQAEALGAPVDEHGRAIDPSTVELPDGYSPEGERAPASDEDKERIRSQIADLPEAAQADLKVAWASGDEKLGRPVLWPLGKLHADEVPHAEGLVNVFRIYALEGRYETPQDAPGTEPAGNPADEAPEAHTGPDTPPGNEPAVLSVEEIAEQVKAMRISDVDGALDDRQIDRDGWNAQKRRAELARALFAETQQ